MKYSRRTALWLPVDSFSLFVLCLKFLNFWRLALDISVRQTSESVINRTKGYKYITQANQMPLLYLNLHPHPKRLFLLFQIPCLITISYLRALGSVAMPRLTCKIYLDVQFAFVLFNLQNFYQSPSPSFILLCSFLRYHSTRSTR